VVQVKKGNVYLNLGDGAVAVGDMLTLIERGEN